MLFLKDLVQISERVSGTSKKKEKATLLAHFLKEAKGKEISLAASYLSGELPQGRLGIGWATLQEAMKESPLQPNPLTLIDLDLYLGTIAQEKGPGSSGRKIQTLRGIFSRSDEKEKEFLTRLIMGEIRQGALEGLVLEAVALASSLSADRLQRSFMFSGNIGDDIGGQIWIKLRKRIFRK